MRLVTALSASSLSPRTRAAVAPRRAIGTTTICIKKTT
jgi:hypothetical protein